MKKEKEKIIYVLLNFHFPRSKYCWNHLPIKEGNTSVSNYKEIIGKGTASLSYIIS